VLDIRFGLAECAEKGQEGVDVGACVGGRGGRAGGIVSLANGIEDQPETRLGGKGIKARNPLEEDRTSVLKQHAHER